VETEKKSIIQQMGIDAQILSRVLGEASQGDFISYDKLSEIIGRDIRSNRGALTTARRAAQREHGKVFSPVRGQGIKCLHDKEVAPMLESSEIKKVRRASNRNLKTLQTVVYEMLSEPDKTKFDAVSSIVGVLSLMTKNKSIKALESACTKRKSALPTAGTLRLFMNGDE